MNLSHDNDFYYFYQDLTLNVCKRFRIPIKSPLQSLGFNLNIITRSYEDFTCILNVSSIVLLNPPDMSEPGLVSRFILKPRTPAAKKCYTTTKDDITLVGAVQQQNDEMHIQKC